MLNSYVRPRNWVLLLPILLAGGVHAQSVDLDFSSLGTALVNLDATRDTLSFSPDAESGYDFQIGYSNPAGLVGYRGIITGNFKIDPISSFGTGLFQGQDAIVTGTGRLSISEGTLPRFTADITWDTVVTLGPSGELNSLGTPNLSNFSYVGGDPVLEELAADSSGTVAATFQFVPSETLDDLALEGSNHSTTFSGSLEAIPESRNAAAILGAVAFLGVLALRALGSAGFGPIGGRGRCQLPD